MLPRFAQAVTGAISLGALLFRSWPAVVVALALVALSLAGPRWSPVARVFRLIAPPPSDLEPAAPVRFAQALAFVFLGAGLACWGLGAEGAGWVLVGMVAALALFSAISGICVGCNIYRLFLRRRHSADDLRPDLGLSGPGPWLVLVTAPGCARCEPVARQVEALSPDRTLLRIDLLRTPKVAETGIKSVPALLAIGRDGSLRMSLTGGMSSTEIAPVLAALANV